MILTVRFVVLLTAGALMIGFSGYFGPLLIAGAGVAALAIVGAAADWLGLTRGVRLEISRSASDKLSLGAENPVHLSVRNGSHAHLRATVRDEYPIGTKARGYAFRLDLNPRSETGATYHVTPRKRGDYSFGDIYVRLSGLLGLAMRQIRFPAEERVKVYPNMLDMRRYEIGLKRDRPVQPGQRVTRLNGRGTDFESLRDAVPDDELRSVDWKATARRGKLTTRQYQQEKSQNVMLVLDCGRVMGPILDGLSRLDHSINAAMMLAHVAALKGDRVGLLTFAEEIGCFSSPKAGHSQTLNLLSITYNLQDAQGDSDYYRAIPYLARKWTRRSLIVLFTDLSDPESSRSLASQVTSLARRHLCMVIAMRDPALTDAAQADVRESEQAFVAAAAQQVLHARRLAGAQLVRAGAIVLDVVPGQFTPAVVDSYLNIKAQGRL